MCTPASGPALASLEAASCIGATATAADVPATSPAAGEAASSAAVEVGALASGGVVLAGDDVAAVAPGGSFMSTSNGCAAADRQNEVRHSKSGTQEEGYIAESQNFKRCHSRR